MKLDLRVTPRGKVLGLEEFFPTTKTKICLVLSIEMYSNLTFNWFLGNAGSPKIVNNLVINFKKSVLEIYRNRL